MIKMADHLATVSMPEFLAVVNDASNSAAGASQDGFGPVHGTVEANVSLGGPTLNVVADVHASDGNSFFTLAFAPRSS